MKPIKLSQKELELLREALDILFCDYDTDIYGQRGVRYQKRILALHDKISQHELEPLDRQEKKKEQRSKK